MDELNELSKKVLSRDTVWNELVKFVERHNIEKPIKEGQLVDN